VESIINAQMIPNAVPATRKSQPRWAIPKRSAISGCAGRRLGLRRQSLGYCQWRPWNSLRFASCTKRPSRIIGKFGTSVQVC